MEKIDLNKLGYQEIEKRYVKFGLDKNNYKFRNAEEVESVLGWDFRTCRGFKDLSPENKNKCEWLICNYLNGFGLKNRHKERPKAVRFEGNKFKVTFTDGYSYLYLNGSIG